MEVSVSDAKARLTDLVRRAEAGEEIVFTRHGQAVARLVGSKPIPADADERRAVLTAVRQAARAKIKPGPGAARSQDDLYDEKGLPR